MVCKYTGKTYILVIYNALYFRNIYTNLVLPVMMRLTGLDVDECPKFLSSKPTQSNHSVYVPVSDIRLPFQPKGRILYLPTRKLLKVELKESKGKYMLITANTSEWDPHIIYYV